MVESRNRARLAVPAAVRLLMGLFEKAVSDKVSQCSRLNGLLF
jgi:hypothetical protein